MRSGASSSAFTPTQRMPGDTLTWRDLSVPEVTGTPPKTRSTAYSRCIRRCGQPPTVMASFVACAAASIRRSNSAQSTKEPGEPFRARVFAEPALRRTDHNSAHGWSAPQRVLALARRSLCADGHKSPRDAGSLLHGVSALGNGVSAPDNGVSAPDNGVSASGNGGSALGNGGSALGNGGSALGNGVSASGNGVSALDNGVSASGSGVSALGKGVSAPGDGVSAWANGMSVLGRGVHALGQGVSVSLHEVR